MFWQKIKPRKVNTIVTLLAFFILILLPIYPISDKFCQPAWDPTACKTTFGYSSLYEVVSFGFKSSGGGGTYDTYIEANPVFMILYILGLILLYLVLSIIFKK